MLRAPYSRFSSFLDGSGSKRTSRRARPLLHAPTPQHRTRTICHGEEVRRECCCCAAHSHTSAHLFYSSHIFFLTGSSLPFFFLTSMQCSAVQCRCAQHRCTAVSACTQPCWCAAGRNEAAAASPLPSPLLFCSSPGRTAAWRTEHSYNAAPSVLELQRCTSSARLPLQHAFHKKYIKIFHRLQHQPMRCFMYMSIYKQGQGACGLCNVHCAVAVRGVQCAVCSVQCGVCFS